MSTARNAIAQAKIEGVLTDLMVKTSVDNVVLVENDVEVTLAAKLAAIITTLNDKVTTTEMNTAISTAISELIGGAPETYDTLKEIADYIAAHEDVVTALNAAIGNKADKTTVDAMQATLDALGALATKSVVSETDLDTALKAKVNAAAEGNHSHANKAVLDEITAEKVTGWDGKSKVYVAAAAPAEMTDNDLLLKLV